MIHLIHTTPASAWPASWPAWTDRVAFWPTTPAAESESFADDLIRVVPALADDDSPEPEPGPEPGTDGEFIDEPTGPDDDDAEWAARNLIPLYNPGWVDSEPDRSAIELATCSALDHHFDAMHADSLDYPGGASPW